MTKKMDEIFNIETIVPETKVTKDVVVVDDNADVDTDYKYARENLYNIIERGSDALNDLVEIAGQSQSPRAYEIVGEMIKTLTDANKDLLEVQKKVKDLKKEEGGPKNVTNALFVGNTTELQRMLKDIK